MARTPMTRWQEAAPAPIVLLLGKEELLVSRANRRIRDILRMEDEGLEVHDIDAGSYDPGTLALQASPSLFMEPKLLRVSDLNSMTDAFLDDAMAMIDDPFDGATVVMHHSGATTRGKRLLDAVKGGKGIVVDCGELKYDSEKQAFARAEFVEAGREATPGAQNLLVKRFSDSIGSLAGAIAQLVADTTGQITEEVVEKYYEAHEHTTAFQVADAAVRGNAAQALVLLRQTLWSGAHPVPIVAAFAYRIRSLAKVSTGQRVRLAPKAIDEARSDLRRFDEAKLARAVRVVAETDLAVKGGERSPEYALERMIRILAA